MLLLLFSSAFAIGILSYLLVILTAYLCSNQSQLALLLMTPAILALPALLMKYLQGLIITAQLLLVANLVALAVLMLLMLLVLAGGSRLGYDIIHGFILPSVIACLNLLLGSASLLFGVWWLRRKLGAP